MGSDNQMNLDINILNIDKYNIIVALKKRKYMNHNYLNYIVRNLSEINAAEQFSYTDNIKVKKDNKYDEAVGIMLMWPNKFTNKELEYHIYKADEEFCFVNDIYVEQGGSFTKEDMLFIRKVENNVFEELRIIPSVEKPAPEKTEIFNESMDLEDLCDDLADTIEEWDIFNFDGLDPLSSIISLLGLVGDTPNPGIKPEDLNPAVEYTKDTPGYLKDFPMCPNIAIKYVNELYTDLYRTYIHTMLFNKTDKTKLTELKKTMGKVYDELQKILPFEQDCKECKFNKKCY